MVFNIFLEKTLNWRWITIVNVTHLFLPYYPNCSPADVLRASLLSCFSPLLVAFSVMLFQTNPYEITCVSAHSIKDCMELLPKLYISLPTTYNIRCVQTHANTHTAHKHTPPHTRQFFSLLCSSVEQAMKLHIVHGVCTLEWKTSHGFGPFYIRFISLVNGVIPGS